MSATKLKKIVFVCTGNTCRSPMAEYLLKKQLKKAKLRGFKVCSAGVAAKKGDLMNPKSVQVLEEHGVAIGKFSSSPISDKLLKEALVFVCMTERQKSFLMDLRWNALRKAGAEDIENNVYSFEELVGYDIPDPYGFSIDEYRRVYEMLEGGMSALIEKLRLKEYALPPKSSTGKTRRKSKKST